MTDSGQCGNERQLGWRIFDPPDIQNEAYDWCEQLRTTLRHSRGSWRMLETITGSRLNRLICLSRHWHYCRIHCLQVYKLKCLIYRHPAIQKKLKNLWTSAPCDQRSCVFTRPTDQLALLSAISNLWWRTVGYTMARTQSWRGASEQFVFLILFVEWLP